MPLSDFLLHVFCMVDDLYRDLVRRPLRSRGPRRTTLTDPEVITVELVGEFLGLDHDKGLFAHFRHYHSAEFPGLLRVCRTTFARQAASGQGQVGLAGGGALFNLSAVTVTDSTFDHNEARGGNGNIAGSGSVMVGRGAGGAILSSGVFGAATLTVSNSTFINNQAVVGTGSSPATASAVAS